ncbi:hypothetical protein ABW21_db0209790 [Orbilia brochopaga]|nr:hypothetical protein ABW21_db0209790 [Drechslerella brochopaga]
MQFKAFTFVALTNILLSLSVAASPMAAPANDLISVDSLIERSAHIIQSREPKRRKSSGGGSDEEDEEEDDMMANSTSSGSNNSGAPMSLSLNAALAAGAGLVTAALLL